MINAVSEKKIEINQSVTIENKNIFKINAVSEMVSACDTRVVSKTKLENIEVTGRELRVSALDLLTGVLEISGEIGGFKYLGDIQNKGLFKRMFK
ncbi:MAG: YabP/YqfC family sporulation protein [Clostridia bacterium]